MCMMIEFWGNSLSTADKGESSIEDFISAHRRVPATSDVPV